MRSIKYHTFNPDSLHGKLQFIPPHICPLCNAGIANDVSYKDTILNAPRNQVISFFTVTQCHACSAAFFTLYEQRGDLIYQPKETYPHKFIGTIFSPYVSAHYPTFVHIYHQAEKAECLGLTDICGVGYRKAVEFLVKDYLMYQIDKADILEDEKKQKKEKIKTTLLKGCIDQIQNESVRKTALKSAWLGNDETHYIRKYQDRDLFDLKKFIKALALCIDLEQTIDEDL